MSCGYGACSQLEAAALNFQFPSNVARKSEHTEEADKVFAADISGKEALDTSNSSRHNPARHYLKAFLIKQL